MNPSSTGWVRKFVNEYTKKQLFGSFYTTSQFYDKLKGTGFIYGVSIATTLDQPISHLQLTKGEYTKLNLFHALLFTFYSERPSEDYRKAIDTIIDFYKTIERGKKTFLQRIRFSSSPSENLEFILAARLQESNTLLKKQATSLLTYALLYVDVLAFIYYLNHKKGLKGYINSLEKTIIDSSVLALGSKEKPNKYDYLIMEMVGDSSLFIDHKIIGTTELSVLEKQFILDICCLAVWDDRQLDRSELLFLRKLCAKLGFNEIHLQNCLKILQDFSFDNSTKIKLFEYTHPVKQFYKQSTETVKLLILRNKNRLSKELSESGELIVLLSQSTLRELSREEKGKVKEQLLDICKTIPSLTIFLLPGGTILLPLLVKLIPKLLPSAFNENRIIEDK